jgi:hypothetical protein
MVMEFAIGMRRFNLPASPEAIARPCWMKPSIKPMDQPAKRPAWTPLSACPF